MQNDVIKKFEEYFREIVDTDEAKIYEYLNVIQGCLAVTNDVLGDMRIQDAQRLISHAVIKEYLLR